MCGICGQFNYRDDAPVPRDDIHTMMNSIVHRGPDDAGSYFAGRLGLGFRRLSIIDLVGGHQPMSDAERSVWVVFNGEIYNFRELKQELIAHGHMFQTNSDTEVIVHGYKQWGREVVNHLNGMFGFAVWDVNRRELMLARDRMGIKPIYYRIESGRLTFASEIRPLLSTRPSPPEVDPVAVQLFLRHRFTPSPFTVLKGIRKLAPGTMMIASEQREPAVERWCNYAPEPFDRMPSDAEAEEHLLELYKRAVKRQLMSDVPLGLLLSGGVDSALLLALMQTEGHARNTYTVGYGSSFADDELADAARSAKLLGAPNYQVELSRNQFEETLSRIVACLEEPVASSSIVPMYHVCERARQDLKVAFVGQGPDELFGGYVRHLGVHYGQYWRELPESVRRQLSHVLLLSKRSETIQRGVHALAIKDRMLRYQEVLSLVPPSFTDRLLRPDVLPGGQSGAAERCWSELAPLMSHTDELGGLQFLEIRSTLPDELLMYADKLSMAHSLEVRVPYLDQEIVHYVERLSASFKIRYGTRKWLHKRICDRFLPREIIRRKKRGFADNVVDDWFRNAIRSSMDDILLDHGSLIYELLSPELVKQTLLEHRRGEFDNHKILFSLVALEQSLRAFQITRRQPAGTYNFPVESSDNAQRVI